MSVTTAIGSFGPIWPEQVMGGFSPRADVGAQGADGSAGAAVCAGEGVGLAGLDTGVDAGRLGRGDADAVTAGPSDGRGLAGASGPQATHTAERSMHVI